MNTRPPILYRWNCDPKIGADGKPVVLKITPRLVKVFELLEPTQYRCLPLHYIHAFVGGSFQTLQRELKLSARRPNCYLNCPEQQKHFYNSNFRAQFYERDKRAVKHLQGIGRLPGPVPARPIEFLSHQIMIDTTFANIDLGAREKGARMIYPREIIHSDAFPKATLKEKFPFSMPVRVSKTFESRTAHAEFEYTNDGLRGIEYPGKKFRFVQIEAEHRNRVDCGNLNQTSFLKKFLAIREIMERGLYKKRWGLPNLLTLVVTPTDERIQTMIELTMRETNDKGCSYVLFQKVPVVEEVLNSLVPNPKFFRSPWKRAGYPEFFLNNPDR